MFRKSLKLLWGDDIPDREGFEFLQRVAEHFASGAVGVHVTTLRIGNENAVQDLLRKPPVALLAFAQRLLGAGASGGLCHQRDQMRRLSVFAGQNGDELVDPHRRAIFVNVAIFDIEG